MAAALGAPLRRVYALGGAAALTLAFAAGPAGAEGVSPGNSAAELEGVTVHGARRADIPLLAQPVAQTPQSILVIPAEVIQLKALGDLRDVLRLDPSVSPHADEDSAQGTNVQIRGYSARNDIYRDGQLDLGRYYRDPFDLEAVEVLTGPSSVMFGRGSTGGAIEMVSKAPRPQGFSTGAISVGSDGLARLTGDVDAPLTPGAAARVNLMVHRSGVAGRDTVYTQRAGISPVVAFGLDGPTRVTLGLLHQTQWDRPDYGVPWIDLSSGAGVSHPAAAPWNAYYGFRDDYSRVFADIATASIRHDFADGWQFHDQLRYAAYGRAWRATDPVIAPVVPAATPLSSITVTRTMRGGHSHESFLENLVDVSGRIEALGLRHNLVMGGQLGRQGADPTVLRFTGVPGVNLIQPDSKAAFSGVSTPRSVTHVIADTSALFVGDTVEAGPRLRLEGAARVDRFAADVRGDLPAPTRFRHTDTQGSWRAAAIFSLAADAEAYVMAGTSFDPSAENLSLSATTADLAPERNRTVEAGVKWTAGQALLTASVFRTIKVNAREPSPTDPTLTILAGTARTQGLEMKTQGRITPRWLVLAGYTFLDATIVASPAKDAGHALQNAPRHSVQLFSAYDLSPGLTVGGGLSYVSSRVPSSLLDPNGLRQQVPGYWNTSALVRWRLTPHASLQLNADNLLDKRFYDGLDDNHVNVGAGRTIRLTLAVAR